MTKREMTMAAIERLGYVAQVDDDGDVLVIYQLKNIYFMTGDEDDTYITAVLPKVCEVEKGGEAEALAVCNKINREMKLVKAHIDQGFKYVAVSCEFFYTDEESLQANIDYSLRFLGMMRNAYNRAKAELSE